MNWSKGGYVDFVASVAPLMTTAFCNYRTDQHRAVDLSDPKACLQRCHAQQAWGHESSSNNGTSCNVVVLLQLAAASVLHPTRTEFKECQALAITRGLDRFQSLL